MSLSVFKMIIQDCSSSFTVVNIHCYIHLAEGNKF